jgi:ribosomal 50S subunit-recycling heat shock protein
LRIDKYLKVSRIIKRRTVAKEACDRGKVSINMKIAKASDEVKIGDIIEIEFGKGPTKYKVLSIEENPKKVGIEGMFSLLE